MGLQQVTDETDEGFPFSPDRGDIAKHNMSEQDIRIDYYSGLLAEAKTVQEEEEERLQELTAFQQFLAAVTPSQSLKDLKRKIQEIHEKVKVMLS